MSRNGWNEFYARAKDWAAETARTKPEALLLLGAGCALLMRTATSFSPWSNGHDGAGRAGRTNGGSASTTERIVEEQPLAVVAIGLAAGALAAALLPRTQFEDETIGDIGEAMNEAAADAGERLKEAGTAAAERFKNSAGEHLKEVALDTAEAFTATASGEPGEHDRSSAPNSGRAENAG